MSRRTLSKGFHQRGSILAELCLVIGLAATLACGVIMPFTAQVEADRERRTQKQLEELQLALTGYAQANGRLPCPADPTLPAGAAQAGHDPGFNGRDCARGYYGAIPWVTLGVPELDGWGRRFVYRVARDLANNWNECVADGTGPSICISAEPPSTSPASADALEIRSRRTSGPLRTSTEPIATGLAVVVLSAGPTGRFAYRSDGHRDEPVPAGGSDEARNASTTSVSFMLEMPRPGSGACDDDRAGGTPCAFDDRLRWISRSRLIRDVARVAVPAQ